MRGPPQTLGVATMNGDSGKIGLIHVSTDTQENDMLLSSSHRKGFNRFLPPRVQLRIQHRWLRCFIGEVVGTFILVVLGLGVMAQSTLSSGARAGLVQMNIGWGLAVAFGIMSGMPLSQGHINPVFSLLRALQGVLPWRLFPVYVLAQFTGAFLGAATIFANYHEAIEQFHGDGNWTLETAMIFSPVPHPKDLSIGCCFLNQVMGTTLLMTLVMVLLDSGSMNLSGASLGFGIGSVVAALSTGLDMDCGATFNPARDLAPRIFAGLAGWGWAPFQAGWWVGAVAPFCGSLLAALIFATLLAPNFSRDVFEHSPHSHR